MTYFSIVIYVTQAYLTEQLKEMYLSLDAPDLSFWKFINFITYN